MKLFCLADAPKNASPTRDKTSVAAVPSSTHSPHLAALSATSSTDASDKSAFV